MTVFIRHQPQPLQLWTACPELRDLACTENSQRVHARCFGAEAPQHDANWVLHLAAQR